MPPSASGKVRDLWDLGDRLLFVASDRISAFDYVLEDLIPHKGEVLTRMSLFWFDLLASEIDNHLITTDLSELPPEFAPFAGELKGRSMIVAKAEMFPVECIVRGYLAGSGLADYKSSGAIGSMRLPSGLENSSRLDEPVYTPSTKAAIGGHDENVSFEHTVGMLGAKNAEALRGLSLAVYRKAREHAVSRGIIIADTKLEFGMIDGRIILADEVLTPDSSRFWPAAGYLPGRDQPSFDKQFVRDWLNANWDRTGAPPRLPQDIIDATSAKYIQAFELLTGISWDSRD
jgi:phosphoribosylaminoimidazole-succinocarboxamide synthase